MKRLLTFLALCCLVVTGAWADVQKLRLSFSSITATGATVSVTDQSGAAVSGVSATVSQAVESGATKKNFFTSGAGFNDNVLGVNYTNSQNNYWEVTFTVSGLSAFSGRSIPSVDVCTPLLNSKGDYQNQGTERTWERTLTVNDSQYGETLSGTLVRSGEGTELWNHFEKASATISGETLTLKVMMKRTDSNGCFSGVKYIDINMPVQQEYTVNITGAPEGANPTVSYGGTAYSNGDKITAGSLNATDLTASAVTGYYPPTVTIGTNTITVAYEKFPFEVASSVENITHWYALNINSNTSNYLSSNGSAIALSNTYESAAAYAWGFVGNATDGYAVYNKATGTYISNAVPCALASEGFHWEVAKGVKGSVFNSGGFCLGEPNKTGNSKYINLQSSALKRWNADNGSTFNAVELTLEEPETPEAVEVPYTLTPTDGATITSIDDLATITLQFTGEDVEEGLMPMTAEYMEKEPVYPTLTKGSTIITATSIAMNDDTGFYDITFPTTDITDGEWNLSIPEGAFYTMDWLTMAELFVAEITATYTVAASSYTYDITITANGANVSNLTIDGEVYAAGEATFGHAIQTSDVTVTEEAGYSYTLNITQPSGDKNGTIVLTYAAQTPDESLAMLETPGTYYVYIKDGGKYLHNNDNGAETAIESAERSQSEIERSNAHIWRLVSDGENVTITNGVGNGYNSATPNTVALADIPTTWHLDNMVDGTKIWNVEILYSENGCIYYGTTPAYNGGFFAAAKTTEHINGTKDPADTEHYALTRGSVEGMEYGHIIEDVDPGKESLQLRYYTPEEEEDFPYLCEQVSDALGKMFEGAVGYPVLDDEDAYYSLLEDDNIKDLFLVGSSEWPEYYREIRSAFNYLAENYTDVVMPQNGEAFRLSVRSNDGRIRYYLKSDGTVTTTESEAEVFVMGSTGTEGYGVLFAGNDNTASKYLQSNGATGTEYAQGKSDFNLKLMVKENDASRITTQSYRRFGTFGLQAMTNAAASNPLFAGKATITLNEKDLTWQTSSCADPLMEGNNSSAIELEEVDYPYTKPNLVPGEGDGHEGVFASVWLPFPMVIPDGIEVYKGTQERTVKDEPYLGLTMVDPDENQCYAAGGYILYSSTVAEGKTLVLPANGVPTDARETEDAAFVGSTEDPENYKGAINPETLEENTTGDVDLWTAFLNDHMDSTPYVLANKSAGMGFYKYIGNSFPKGKAIWLKPSSSSDAECVKLGFDDIISAIEALHGNTTNAEIFDLQGRRLDKVQKGQINVINGQKIMFK